MTLHALGLLAVWCALPAATTRPLQVKLAPLTDSTASWGETCEFHVEPAPSETVEIEPVEPVDNVAAAEPGQLEALAEASCELTPSDDPRAAWQPPRAERVCASDAFAVVRRRHVEVTTIADPVAAAPTPTSVASVAQAKVLAPLVGCNPPPDYPALARQRRIEGVVELLLIVDAEGRVVDLTVVASSGSRLLDQAAIKAARQWRFENGPGQAQVPFRFDLTARTD